MNITERWCLHADWLFESLLQVRMVQCESRGDILEAGGVKVQDSMNMPRFEVCIISVERTHIAGAPCCGPASPCPFV